MATYMAGIVPDHITQEEERQQAFNDAIEKCQNILKAECNKTCKLGFYDCIDCMCKKMERLKI